MPDTLVGASVKRLEDPRLLRGQGRYTADLRDAGTLAAAFVRSPYAHARIASLDLAAARATPGVVAVFAAGDLPSLGQPTPSATPGATAAPELRAAPVLANGTVHYVGEPVAIVVADTAAHARDGADAVAVEYEPVPVVIDAEQAQLASSALVHPGVTANVAGRQRRSVGDVEAVFASTDVVVSERFEVARQICGAMEPRAILAVPAEDGRSLTVWYSTQNPYNARRALAALTGLPPANVRVISADVGGGFGPKGRLYPDEAASVVAAHALRRPVLFSATRQEDTLSTYPGRGLIAHAEVAARQDGILLGLRVRLIQDVGAYAALSALGPAGNTLQHLHGPYRWQAVAVDAVGVYTNKVPISPLRGGGRELGVYVLERMLDRVAQRLGLDPLELRRRNLLGPDAFPFDTRFPLGVDETMVFDSGDYPAYLQRAAEMVGYASFRQQQPADRQQGRLRGIAVTTFLESTGRGAEGARVTLEADGTVTVQVGSPSNGQAHATTFAQVCAERLGVPLERVRLTSGDTAQALQGGGTNGSRMAVTAGNAVARAALAVREHALTAAAQRLEVAPDDLTLADGVVRVQGAPDRSVTLAELAASERIEHDATFEMDSPACYAGGAHAAIVAVDPETGLVDVEHYVVVHDCGTVINPVVVEGQVHGGVAHGFGNALLEGLAYDADGQVLTADWTEYAMPSIGEPGNRARTSVPGIQVEHMQCPSPWNPEGIKGAGEGGTIGALATLAAAVEDALAPLGARLTDLPIRAEQLASLATGTSPAPVLR